MTEEAFEAALTGPCGVAPGAHLLCAVSGGADSTALLLLCCSVREKLGLRVSCAHAEHGIRGESSLADMAFTEALCRWLNVPFYGKHLAVPAYASNHGLGLEAAARELRYAFLNETADEIGADRIALAHHLLDQAETVLFHAARGCDLRGLCGMRYRSGRLIRPLLEVSPEALRHYLRDKGQDWREDESNADIRYARNRLRGRVMPELEQVCTGAPEHLARLSDCAKRDEDFFDTLLKPLKCGIQSCRAGAVLRRDVFHGLHEALTGRLLTELIETAGLSGEYAVIRGAARILGTNETAVLNLPEDGKLLLGDRYVCALRRDSGSVPEPIREGMTETSFGRFLLREALPRERGDGFRKQAIPGRSAEGLTVRPRVPGDVMTPFGHRAPVSLKKLLNEKHIPSGLRGGIPMVCRSDTIIWAVGVRAAEDCRTAQDEPAMILEFDGFLP